MRRRSIQLTVCCSLLWACAIGTVHGQPEDRNSVEERIKTPPPSTDAVLKGVMILRVSEKYLEQLFARDINKETAVTRVVLGTRARGKARTTGRADVDTKPEDSNAAFYVRISGSTISRTVGHNNSAIIHSHTVTQWTAEKIVRFSGENFVTSPATIESHTKITPLGTDSSLPGLRGRIVSRIASRKAVELNCHAERISGGITERQVLTDVDHIVDSQIQKLNERIENRPLMSFLLPRLEDVGVTFSTSSNCINISFIGGDAWPLAKVCPVEGIDPSDTELWLQTALISRPKGDIPEAIDNAGAWVSKMLPDVQLPGVDLSGKDGVLPISVEVVDGWVVFRSSNLRNRNQQTVSRDPN